MAVGTLANSWQYDFQIKGYGRQRQAGLRTKVEALEAERRARSDLISGRRRLRLAEAYEQYASATTMKDRSRDFYGNLWPQIEPTLGHLFIEEVDTAAVPISKWPASNPTPAVTPCRTPGVGRNGLASLLGTPELPTI